MSATVALPHPLLERFQTARELLRVPVGEEDWNARIPTNLQAVDRLLEGGIARGEMVELTGRRSSGRFSIVLEMLTTATRVGETATLVDLGGHFDPQQAEALGMDLERFLWLRPQAMKQTLASAEILITGGFPLVVLDLGAPPIAGGRGAQSSWQRLLKAARSHRAALLVSTPYRCCGPAATTVLEVEKARAKWSGQGHSPRLLETLRSRVKLGKGQGRAPGAIEELRLHCTTGSVFSDPERYSDPEGHSDPELSAHSHGVIAS